MSVDPTKVDEQEKKTAVGESPNKAGKQEKGSETVDKNDIDVPVDTTKVDKPEKEAKIDDSKKGDAKVNK